MLIKTPEFTEKFLIDLSKIIFNNEKYKNTLETKLKTVKNVNDLLENQRVFENINFVGSFKTKKYNKIISDIDMIQYTKFNSFDMSRLSQIIKINSNVNSNIRFIRFYCGERIKLPWKIDDKGNCNFSLDNTYKWLEGYVKKYIPEDIYKQIFDILKTQESLSIRDLIGVEEIIRPYTSLSWSEKDIIQGFKIDNGVRYDLLDTLKNSEIKNVIKFLYIYDNKNDSVNKQKEYCLLDCSLNKPSNSTINFYSYYLNDKKNKFKGLKFHLPEDIKHTYRESIISNIGYLTSLESRLELILKIEKYNKTNNLISKDELKRLLKDVMNFASENKYAFNKNVSIAENQKILENIILEKFDYIYNIYRPLVKQSNIKDIILYELRGEEGSLKIHKDILQERLDKGITCPFFTLTGEDIKIVINVSIKAKLDPKELLNCVYKVANEMQIETSSVVELFSKKNLSILDNDNLTFNIIDNKEKIKENLTLKDAQYYILFGI